MINNFKQFTSAVALSLLAVACGGDSRESAGIESFVDAISAVSDTLDDIAKLNPTSPSIVSNHPFRTLSAVGSTNWNSGTVRLPDESGTTLSIKDYMGRQLDPDAMGTGDGGRDFALNVFGRFNNSMMIGCALMTIGEVDQDTGYPANGNMTISMTPANLNTMVEKCGMAESDASAMTATPPLEISSVVESATDTTYYDKKVTMTLPAEMGGATQYVYFRFNSSEVNIFNAEDGSSFDSRTLVKMDLDSEVLKVEYYSGGAGVLYFHRLYYDKANDIGKMATFYGSASDYVQYTLAGKPNSGGTFALSFQSDQTQDYDGQACVNVETGDISTDDSLACTITGTSVSSATAISDALTRTGDADWATPSETTINNYDVDTIFTVAAP